MSRGSNKEGDKTRVLWLSRHKPKDEQVEDLKNIFGSVEVIYKNTYIKNAKHVMKLKKQLNADEVVPVVPRRIRQELVNKLDENPLLADMTKSKRNGEYTYYHNGFYRVEQELKTQPLSDRLKRSV